MKPVSLADTEVLLRESGLLYAINVLILHPFGLALTLSYDDADLETPISLLLMHSDEEGLSFPPMTFDPECAEEVRGRLATFLERTPANPSNIDLLKKLL